MKPARGPPVRRAGAPPPGGPRAGGGGGLLEGRGGGPARGGGRVFGGGRGRRPPFQAGGVGGPNPAAPFRGGKPARAPAATLDATRPPASSRTAIGVPRAANASPAASPSSSNTMERKPSARVLASSPEDTTTSRGLSALAVSSQLNRSPCMARQKPQSGFQNRSSVSRPRRSASFTGVPSRAGSSSAGAGAPIGTPGASTTVATSFSIRPTPDA